MKNIRISNISELNFKASFYVLFRWFLVIISFILLRSHNIGVTNE